MPWLGSAKTIPESAIFHSSARHLNGLITYCEANANTSPWKCSLRVGSNRKVDHILELENKLRYLANRIGGSVTNRFVNSFLALI